ncbi:hypothetical protein LIER_36998 [Lithospermum erythrorhizon]|uniref:Uncharacterized protein n=1 Tax=Lithospermum erythrorhizon TaxID=34254 RepID=A0AAV3PHK7_LITER
MPCGRTSTAEKALNVGVRSPVSSPVPIPDMNTRAEESLGMEAEESPEMAAEMVFKAAPVDGCSGESVLCLRSSGFDFGFSLKEVGLGLQGLL